MSTSLCVISSLFARQMVWIHAYGRRVVMICSEIELTLSDAENDFAIVLLLV